MDYKTPEMIKADEEKAKIENEKAEKAKKQKEQTAEPVAEEIGVTETPAKELDTRNDTNEDKAGGVHVPNISVRASKIKTTVNHQSETEVNDEESEAKSTSMPPNLEAKKNQLSSTDQAQ